MTKRFFWLTALLPLWLSSCATPPPPQAFHNTDATALIIKTVDNHSGEVMAPTAIGLAANDRVLTQARALTQHQTAVVVLENYSEPKLGPQFRARACGWFISLRGLGYQNIYFLQGEGLAATDGLRILVAYN